MSQRTSGDELGTLMLLICPVELLKISLLLPLRPDIAADEEDEWNFMQQTVVSPQQSR